MNSMSTQASVLALIPARAGSKGVPGKNTRALAGKPLLHYSCRCALESDRVTRTIVSTDCEQIAATARLGGAEVPFLRPAELARDDSPSHEVIVHAVEWLGHHEGAIPEFVVLLQPTAPLRRSSDVDAALARLQASDADSVVSVCPVESHFHPEWQFKVQGDSLQTYSGIPVGNIPPRRQLLEPTYVRNGAIYAFRTDAFLAKQSIYGDRCLAFVMPRERSVNIDTLSDWNSAEIYLQTLVGSHEAA
jgi:CMP-N,N'-diacetyllegionaminic acid synthase